MFDLSIFDNSASRGLFNASTVTNGTVNLLTDGRTDGAGTEACARAHIGQYLFEIVPPIGGTPARSTTCLDALLLIFEVGAMGHRTREAHPINIRHFTIAFRKSTRQRATAVAALAALLLAISPIAASGGDVAPERCAIAPQEWRPSLEDVIDYVEEQQKAQENAPQSALTRAGQIRAALRDAQLFFTYVQLMQALDANSQADLFTEQQQWLSRRAEQANAGVTSRGGTLAPLEHSAEYAKITEERQGQLQRRLQDLAKK